MNKHKNEDELKKLTYHPSGRATQVPSFYDPRDGKLTEIEAANLSLHKCAQESKQFRKDLGKAQSTFEFAKEDISAYESKFQKSRLKSGKWTRSSMRRGRHEPETNNWMDNLIERSSTTLGLDKPRVEIVKRDYNKFSYPHYFMSEDYHLAESRNDAHANLMMVKNHRNPSYSNIKSAQASIKRPGTTMENYREPPGFGRQQSRGLIPKNSKTASAMSS